MNNQKIPNSKILSCLKSAFTLAEILITLAIIGVVAAMVIPAITTAADKQATISGYKEAYATLTTAIKMSEATNGTIDTWDFPSAYYNTTQGVSFAQTYLIPYLKISKKCEATTGYFITPKTPIGNNSGYTAPVQYILSNGMSICLRTMGVSGRNLAYANTGEKSINILVDINGNKNPNTLGKDVFSFILADKAAAIHNGGNGDLARSIKIGGIYPDGFGTNITGAHYTFRGCGKELTYNLAGLYCGMKIIQDGYEIKSDYPW